MQSPLIFKSTNITTMIGETIEFNCSEYMKLQQYTTSVFKWYKVSISSYIFNVGVLTFVLTYLSNTIICYFYVSQTFRITNH